MMNPGTVHVQVVNLRNDHGLVRVSLYNSPDGFPTDAAKAYKVASAKIVDGKCILSFENLSPGEYALVLLHDENENGKMDTNFLGMPTEGYGASNDAKAILGPPKYTDAKFALTGSKLDLTIKVKYL